MTSVEQSIEWRVAGIGGALDAAYARPHEQDQQRSSTTHARKEETITVRDQLVHDPSADHVDSSTSPSKTMLDPSSGSRDAAMASSRDVAPFPLPRLETAAARKTLAFAVSHRSAPPHPKA